MVQAMTQGEKLSTILHPPRNYQKRVVRRPSAMRTFVALGTTVAMMACSSSEARHPLFGEWSLRLRASENAEAGFDKSHGTGRFVFHPGIECYCDESARPPAGAIFGRGYLAFEPTSGAMPAEIFQSDPFADMREEVMAAVGRENTLTMQRSRGMSGVQFRGRISGDSVRGTWSLLSHGDTLRTGSFEMWRAPASAYTDSALSRASRGIRRWKTARPVLPKGPTDTLEPVTPLSQ
jgi:hypothetical protein